MQIKNSKLNELVLKNISDGIVVADPKTMKFVFVNSAFCRITKYKKEELLKLKISNIHPKNKLTRILKQFNDQVKKKIKIAKNIPVLKKDKSIAYFDINSSTLKINSKEYIIGIFRDITDRKYSEDTLKKSEKMLSEIIRGSSIATIVLDKEHKIIHWNKACEKISGYPASKMIGTNIQWKPWYPRKRPIMADIIIDGNSSDIEKYYKGKYRKYELIKGCYEAEDFFPHLGKNGLWFYFTAVPIRDEKNNIMGAIETIQDITKRKIFEKELKESENRYKTLVELSPDGMVVHDGKKILYTNKSALKIIGAKNEKEVINRPVNYFVHPDYIKIVKKRVIKMLEEKKPQPPTKEIFLKLDGSPVNVEVTASPMIYKGKNAIQVVFRDITDRLKIENKSKKRLKELEKFHNVTVDRELKMVQLKKKIKKLESQLKDRK